jgi:hypothetical protein
MQSSWLWKKLSLAFFHEGERQKPRFFSARRRRLQRRMTVSTDC